MVGWYDQLNGHEFEQTLGDREGEGKPGVLQSMELQKVGHDLVTEQQHYSKEKALNDIMFPFIYFYFIFFFNKVLLKYEGERESF